MSGAAEPVLNNRFIVDLGDGKGTEAFLQVVFPDAMTVGVTGPLVLSRAASGDLRLHRWWSSAREAARSRSAPRDPQSAAPRDVTVTLLSSDAVPVVTWRFLAATPLSLGYSSLDANGSAIVAETIALDFQRLEMG